MRDGITEAEYRALAEFRWALRRFLHFSETAARAAGLAPQQHQAMLAIKGFGRGRAITMGDLADRLQIRHHSAVGLIDRLARRGLVKRVSDAKDRRLVHLALTNRGERLLETLSAAHREQLRRIGPSFSRQLEKLNQAGKKARSASRML